jgi:surface protein
MFKSCTNFNANLKNWELNKDVKFLNDMFYECENFTGKGLENWDVSNIIDMSGMFFKCKQFNINLSNWDVNNVQKTKFMFSNCENFKGKGLSNWNFLENNIKNISFMFYKCNKFKEDLSNWNISENFKPFNMRHMFDDCNSLRIIPNWFKTDN